MTSAITSVPVLVYGASLGFALALAERVVPVLVGAAVFVLHTLTHSGLIIKEKPRGANCVGIFATAIVEVEILIELAG